MIKIKSMIMIINKNIVSIIIIIIIIIIISSSSSIVSIVIQIECGYIYISLKICLERDRCEFKLIISMNSKSSDALIEACQLSHAFKINIVVNGHSWKKY